MPCSTFMHAAHEQTQRLTELRRSQRHEDGQAEAIQACQQQMKELEGLVEDSSDLALPAPWRPRDHVAHRRALVAALYEELRELAARLQAATAREQQREAEAAGFFTAAPQPTRAPRPPAAPCVGSDGGPGAWPQEVVSSERLRMEEQALLAEFETDLDKITETQAKIGEVAALVGLFSTKVMEQQEQADNIFELAEESTELVEKAGKHLDRAVENSNAYRFYVVCWFVGSALALLAFDFIDERFSPI